MLLWGGGDGRDTDRRNLDLEEKVRKLKETVGTFGKKSRLLTYSLDGGYLEETCREKG